MQAVFSLGDFRFRYRIQTFGEYVSHSHAGIELHFCEEGQGYYHTRQERKEMVPGRVTLIFGPMLHEIHSDPTKSFCRTVLHIPDTLLSKIFSFLEVKEIGFFPTPERPLVQLLPSKQTYESMRRIFRQIDQELRRERTKIGPGVTLYLAELLHVFRHGAQQVTTCSSPASPHDQRLVEKAMALVKQDPYNPLTPNDLAESIGISRGHLWRLFDRVLGVSPQDYILEQRLNVAKRLLLDGVPISQIALKFRYADTSSFSRAFKSQIGLSPRSYVRAYQVRLEEKIQ